jgi:hypothetical protein
MPPLPSPIHATDNPYEEAASVGGVGSERESVDDEDVALSRSEESEGAPPREVGHNLYILADKLAKFVPLTYYSLLTTNPTTLLYNIPLLTTHQGSTRS